MFKFSFDDIDESGQDHQGSQQQREEELVKCQVPLLPATKHSLRDLITSPVRISYTRTHGLYRRDVFDVKYQLMAQESLSATDRILLGETNEDIRSYTYEGGLKVWECTYDLVGMVEQVYEAEQNHGSVLEMGCGAALPSARLLQLALKHHKALRLVLADYNQAVLRLVTVPNLILAWLDPGQESGEIDIDEDLIARFEQALVQADISVEFISGAWSPEFEHLAGTHSLVLASETIYSPETCPQFTQCLLRCIQPGGAGLVAAKRVYFGVGGSINGFIDLLNKHGASHTVVFEHNENIGRVVLRVSGSVSH